MNRQLTITALSALAVLSTSAHALVLGPTAGLTMEEIDNTSPGPNNGNFISLARNPTGGTNVTSVAPTVNHATAPWINFGAFTPKITLNNVDGSGYMVRWTGFINIPTAGVWSLQNWTDDPFFVQFGGLSGPSWTDTACCNNSRTTQTLAAGVQPIEIIMAEFGGADYSEFSMALGEKSPGVPLDFSTSTYSLLGVSNGGLAIATTAATPDGGTTFALLGLGLAGMVGAKRKLRRS